LFSKAIWKNNDPFNKVLTFAETSIFCYMIYKLLIPAAFALMVLSCHSNDQRKKINAGLIIVCTVAVVVLGIFMWAYY